MGLTLGILEGQNFTRKNHHGVGPRRAGAAELAPSMSSQRRSICPHLENKINNYMGRGQAIEVQATLVCGPG